MTYAYALLDTDDRAFSYECFLARSSYPDHETGQVTNV